MLLRHPLVPVWADVESVACASPACCHASAGYDLAMNISAASPQVCAQLCSEHELCTHFTYVWDGCYLKTSGEGKITSNSAVSGACAASATAEAPAVSTVGKLERCVVKTGVDVSLLCQE